MRKVGKSSISAQLEVGKCRTGINGLDAITGGGLPRGRPTLICGGPGCGKTLFGVEFLARGALDFDEPGVLLAFEETRAELVANAKSIGVDLEALERKKKVVIDHVRIERSEIDETGEYDLEGLFLRLAASIDEIGAKRVVIDTLEVAFTGLDNERVLRSEFRRLMSWLKDRGITAIVTAERGRDTLALTRYGIEEYVSDCVILLDNRVQEQIATRRLRIIKYRGSEHGSNEYPFLIDADGITVLPITSLQLDYAASTQVASTGVAALDEMFAKRGLYRGSSVLISGTAGTGKTSIAATVALAACERGERALYFAFEESPDGILRNMRAIGVDLRKHVASGLLHFHAARPTMVGLEAHLALMHKAIDDARPSVVVIDPVTNFMVAGTSRDVHAMLYRIVDHVKSRQLTCVMTSLTEGGEDVEKADVGISSAIDVWIVLRVIESQGERNRGLQIVKARGMGHSNQIREFILTKKGISLVPVYTGSSGVLTGSARIAQEQRERAAELAAREDLARGQRHLERRQLAVAAQIAALQADFEAEAAELARSNETAAALVVQAGRDRDAMAKSRYARDRQDTRREGDAANGRRNGR